jgi:hypothetical protein
MYTVHQSNAWHYLANSPVEMPLDILLGLPDYVTEDPAAPLFNLPGAVSRLLGRFGWERANRVLSLRVWAPQWTADKLERFASSPFNEHTELFAGVPASRFVAPEFPGTGALRDVGRPDFPEYEIVHFIGGVEWREGERALKISEDEGWWLDAAALDAVLRAARVRLLILQVPARQHTDSRELAEQISAAGGPAVLVASFSDPSLVNAYLLDLYAGLVHNQDLESVARPMPGPLEEVSVDLFVGQGGSLSLRFDGWLESIRRRVQEVTLKLDQEESVRIGKIVDLLGRLDPVLHRAQTEALLQRRENTEARVASLRSNLVRMSSDLETNLNWAHESGGAVPLSTVAEIMPTLEAEAGEVVRLYTELEAEADTEAQHAPRVLNANFGDPSSGRLLTPDEGLVAGEEYDLLVDVGPRWNRNPTIVSGHASFPADALPPDASGHVIDVVLVSDDFHPRFVSAKFWLPRAGGRSQPIVDGRPVPKSGPIGLRVRAPSIENPIAVSSKAMGRLFLYYENNLLQSALLDVGVVREAGVTVDRKNSIEVDYVLTGTFSDVGAQFERRKLRLADRGDDGSHPVRLNITLNQDGRGTHRILVRGRDDLPPAWTAYDPLGALDALRAARRTISGCFWARDEDGDFVLDGRGERVPGLDGRNGKSRRQFFFDLFHMARIGRRLHNEMLAQLLPEAEDVDRVEWSRRLRERLDSASVIQVSRIKSAPTQYAFPWGLVYEYPLRPPASRWRPCDVLSTEWSKEGRRDYPMASSCPFKDETWHSRDVLCPYGFWGLKHVIEQPLTPAVKVNGVALTDAVKEIPLQREIGLSIGWTRDRDLDLAHIDRHVEKISKMRGMRLAGPPPNPADEVDGVETILAAPNLVYFICHCEKDPAENQPYLYVGPRDGSSTRKIYPNTIIEWAQTTLDEWKRLKPLVFINGCHTGDLEPGEVLNFVSAFELAQAAGIIGTEVSVQLRVATEVAERFLQKVVAGEGVKIGQAMREVRWELANKGNLLGLCYTLYGLSDLRFTRGDT